MNCNKKSHFDSVTPVHRHGGEGGVGGWWGGGVEGVGVGWGALGVHCLQGGGALTAVKEKMWKNVEVSG